VAAVAEHKWTYMEHWRTPSPQGPSSQYASRRELDRFVRHFNLRQVVEMFGSLPAFEAFLRERGIEKLVGVFHASRFTPIAGPHAPETHDFYYGRVEALMQQLADVAVENIVVMPLGA
jgi:inosose dehydratase